MSNWLRGATASLVILGLWQGAILIWSLPSFILPAPMAVFEVLISRWPMLWSHTWVTAQEVLIGLALGVSIGLCFALLMLLFRPVKQWLLPILIASQAIPVLPSHRF